MLTCWVVFCIEYSIKRLILYKYRFFNFSVRILSNVKVQTWLVLVEDWVQDKDVAILITSVVVIIITDTNWIRSKNTT